MIPNWFLKLYPGLKAIIIAGGNVRNNVEQADRDLQVLTKVSQRVQSGMGFDVIKKSLDVNRFKNVEEVPGIFQFARNFNGRIC